MRNAMKSVFGGKSSKPAFTLIELLIVVAIIGILATLIFVNVGSVRKKARDAKRMADLKNLQTALEMRYQEEGNYPTTAGAWYATNGGYLTNYIPGLTPTYVSTLPTPPLHGTTGYYYSYRSNGPDYKLRACLAEVTVGSSEAFYDPTMATCFQVSSSPTARSW